MPGSCATCNGKGSAWENESNTRRPEHRVGGLPALGPTVDPGRPSEGLARRTELSVVLLRADQEGVEVLAQMTGNDARTRYRSPAGNTDLRSDLSIADAGSHEVKDRQITRCLKTRARLPVETVKRSAVTDCEGRAGHQRIRLRER